MIGTSLKLETAHHPLNLRERFVEGLKIWLVIKPLQLFYRKSAHQLQKELSVCPKGTIGQDLNQLLKTHNLSVIPKFENHDLKHLILGYGMTPIEEIRMQMYMLGNGNYSPFCPLFVVSGLLFPNKWKDFYKEYKKGRKAPSILRLKITDCMIETSEDLKTVYNR